MRSAARRVLFVTGLALVAAVPRVAAANGRFPAASMLVERPGDPTRLALRATYGLLFSNDSGASWDWVCERAIGYSGNEDPSLVIAGSGAIVVGTFDGMARSTDGGCHWDHDVHGPTSVIDLASRPSAPDQLYAVTCQFAGESDAATNRYRSELFVSNDAGNRWTSRATLDPSLLVDSVEVAPSDAHRVYISAIRTRGATTSAVLLRSDDDGAHWVERAVPFMGDDRGLYIAAVDPERAARVYLRTNGLEASHLLVSEDGGQSIHELAPSRFAGPLQGFALAENGASIYVGGPKDGLLRGSAGAPGEGSFVQMSKIPAQCLTAIGKTLWECAPASAGYVLGASIDRGATFAAKLTLGGMRGPLQCASPSAMDACGADWSALQSLVGNPIENDAGDRDASPSMSKGPDAARALPGLQSRFVSLALAGACVIAALLVAWRVARRRR